MQTAEEDWKEEHGEVPSENTDEAPAEPQAGSSTRSLGESARGPAANLRRSTRIRHRLTDNTATTSTPRAHMGGDMEAPSSLSHDMHGTTTKDSDEQGGKE